MDREKGHCGSYRWGTSAGLGGQGRPLWGDDSVLKEEETGLPGAGGSVLGKGTAGRQP